MHGTNFNIFFLLRYPSIVNYLQMGVFLNLERLNLFSLLSFFKKHVVKNTLFKNKLRFIRIFLPFNFSDRFRDSKDVIIDYL
jgi:hypothetical protein